MKHWRLVVAASVFSMMAACSSPETDWQKAEAENTEAAYQAFLEKYGEGEWAQKAQSRLDAIKDAQDWELARATDAIDSYNSYLLDHPTGAHMGEARQRIMELQTEAAWSAAQSAGTRQALEEFLMRYADAPQAEQARNMIAALAPPPAPPPKPQARPATKSAATGATAALPGGSHHVQLGAFSSLDKAQSEKTRIEKRYRGIVGSLSVQRPAGSDKLYRLRTAGTTEAAARSACQKLKASGQDCVVVSR